MKRCIMGYMKFPPLRLTEKIFTSKEGKQRLGECEIVLILRAKRENEVEAQRREKLPIKQKCPYLFT